MNINATSLAIGISVGIVIAISAVFALRLGEPANPVDADVLANSNGTHFWMDGLIKEFSSEHMAIDQTFGNPGYTDNPNVIVRLDRGAVFLNCYDKETGESAPSPALCSETITDDEIEAGLYVCALTRMYNGEFYAGKTWLYSACGPFQNEITAGEN